MEPPRWYHRALSRDQINALALYTYGGRIELISADSAEDRTSAALGQLRQESLLGFDTETRPAFRRGESYPPAILQLAGSDAVFVFQLDCMPFPEGLKSILCTPTIVKAGVAIRDDLRGLQRLCPLQEAGFVDIGEVAAQHGLKTRGLRNLTANLLGVRISKGAQRSNWSRRDLAPRQLVYAATDAWASREVYLRLRELGLIPTLPGLA